MKKKNITVISSAFLLMTILSGCGKDSSSTPSLLTTNAVTESTVITTASSDSGDSETKQTSVTEATTKAAVTTTAAQTTITTEAPTEAATVETDETASVSRNADGSFNVTFGDGLCTMTLPASWAGRIIIDDYKIYSKLCYDTDQANKWGKMLSIKRASADDMKVCIPSSYLIGTAGKEYIVAYTPTDVTYDIANSALHEEYSSLYNDITSVIASARCMTSPDFSPIDLSVYVNPGDFYGSVSGSWDDADTYLTDVQFTPYLCFRPSDASFAYMYRLNGSEADYVRGSYLMNTNVSGYQWNTDNWGEFGLIFADGAVYRFTLYYSAPQTLGIEKVAGVSEYETELYSGGWVYTSAFENFDANYNDY